MNGMKFSAAEVKALLAKYNGRQPEPKPAPDPRRVYKRVTPAMCIARRRAELAGKDTSMFPARERLGVLKRFEIAEKVKRQNHLINMRNWRRAKKGWPPIPKLPLPEYKRWKLKKRKSFKGCSTKSEKRSPLVKSQTANAATANGAASSSKG